MIIEVKVIPNSSQNCVVSESGNHLKIKCRAPAEKGAANDAVIEILSAHFSIPKKDIRLIRGKNSSRKMIEIQVRR